MGSNEKKAEVKTYKTASKRVKVKVKDTATELKEDWGLFARMLIVGCSRQEIKSDLIKILEAIPPKEGSIGAASLHQQNLSDTKVAIVYGMAEV